MAIGFYLTVKGDFTEEVTISVPPPDVPPLGANVRHFISQIEIVRFVATDLSPSQDPILITSTNMEGNPIFLFDNSGPKTGQVDRLLITPSLPFQSVDSGLPITITCPKQDKTMWQINLDFYSA
jgi:hypothetical protein